MVLEIIEFTPVAEIRIQTLKEQIGRNIFNSTEQIIQDLYSFPQNFPLSSLWCTLISSALKSLSMNTVLSPQMSSYKCLISTSLNNLINEEVTFLFLLHQFSSPCPVTGEHNIWMMILKFAFFSNWKIDAHNDSVKDF